MCIEGQFAYFDHPEAGAALAADKEQGWRGSTLCGLVKRQEASGFGTELGRIGCSTLLFIKGRFNSGLAYQRMF